MVDDAIERNTSLVLEGVSLVPSTRWIEKWEEAGGVACGVLLTVTKEEVHRNLLRKRGFITGNQGNEQKKLDSFDRVRLIQDEMIKRAQKADWILIEQKIEPDPLEIIENEFLEKEGCANPFAEPRHATNSAKVTDNDKPTPDGATNNTIQFSDEKDDASIDHVIKLEPPNGEVEVDTSTHLA